jgi:hypothetical protein
MYVHIFYRLVNYGVVLLLVVLSLMAGLTTGVPMSTGYGGYQTATPASYYTTTYAATGYYTPKATSTPKLQSLTQPRV